MSLRPTTLSDRMKPGAQCFKHETSCCLAWDLISAGTVQLVWNYDSNAGNGYHQIFASEDLDFPRNPLFDRLVGADYRL